MNIEQTREMFFEDYAKVFKVLSSPIRLKLFNFLSFSPRTVEDCAQKFNQSIQNISLHLMTLRNAGILEVDQVKNFRFYSLASSELTKQISKMLSVTNDRITPVDWETTVDFKQIAFATKKGKVTLLDLRDFNERSYLPVPHSLHFEGSLKNIDNYLDENSLGDKEIILFCKGKMCERLAHFANYLKPHYNVKTLSLSSFELKELIAQF